MARSSLTGIQKLVTRLVREVAPRNRDIIARRFGFASGRRETLEAIGSSYGITRERVRQIEEATVSAVAKIAQRDADVNAVVASVIDVLQREGGVMRQDLLFQEMSGSPSLTTTNAALVFVLTVSNQVFHAPEGDHFHAFWAAHRAQADAFRSGIQALSQALKSHAEPMEWEAFCGVAKSTSAVLATGMPVNEKHLVAALAISKDIGKNIYGQVGLSAWPQVNPKGIRDKAYLVLKREAKPQHFSAITKLISAAAFPDGKRVNMQTVHNELIKDKRFILVGRGLYALSEWGYQAGTVKDVLVHTLKEAKSPLPKAELISRVLANRMVKESTIVLNLQDSATFAKQADGTYTLRKA